MRILNLKNYTGNMSWKMQLEKFWGNFRAMKIQRLAQRFAGTESKVWYVTHC